MADSITEYPFVAEGYESPILDSQKKWVERKIMESELELRARLGDLTKWIAKQTDPDDAAERIKVVVSRMVHRVLRNPHGYDSETDGEYSYSRRSSVHPAGEVVATRSDWRLLGYGRASRGPRSYRMGLPADSPRNMIGGCR